jgi:hypothetical protein
LDALCLEKRSVGLPSRRSFLSFYLPSGIVEAGQALGERLVTRRWRVLIRVTVYLSAENGSRKPAVFVREVFTCERGGTHAQKRDIPAY